MAEKKKTSKIKNQPKKSVKPTSKQKLTKVSKATKSVKVSKKANVAKSVSTKKTVTTKKKRSFRAVILYILSIVVLLGIIVYGVISLLPCGYFQQFNLPRFFSKSSKFVVISSAKDNSVERVTLDLEIADNDPARLKGLMGRENLEKNTGMLFDFEEPGDYSMWMKDTLIPLDMVFVNNFNKVIALASNRKPMNENLINPCSLEYEHAVAIGKRPTDEDGFYDACEEKYSRPSKQTRYVIELPAGTIKESGIRLGDILLKK